jgi:hypothetical protein
VKGVRRGEQRLSAESFKTIAAELKLLTPGGTTPESAVEEIAAPAAGPATVEPAQGLVITEDMLVPVTPPPISIPIVQQIHVDAYVSNWDADPEVDGLVVHLFAYTWDGVLLPVAGTLEATLIGRRLASRQHTEQFPDIGVWTKSVLVPHWGPAGAIYRLPFEQLHPDFDFSLLSQGALNVRLIVPGQGNFEATAAMVRIRPYSSLRDQLQMRRGTRFFSVERTGRTQ